MPRIIRKPDERPLKGAAKVQAKLEAHGFRVYAAMAERFANLEICAWRVIELRPGEGRNPNARRRYRIYRPYTPYMALATFMGREDLAPYAEELGSEAWRRSCVLLAKDGRCRTFYLASSAVDRCRHYAAYRGDPVLSVENCLVPPSDLAPNDANKYLLFFLDDGHTIRLRPGNWMAGGQADA